MLLHCFIIISLPHGRYKGTPSDPRGRVARCCFGKVEPEENIKNLQKSLRESPSGIPPKLMVSQLKMIVSGGGLWTVAGPLPANFQHERTDMCQEYVTFLPGYVLLPNEEMQLG